MQAPKYMFVRYEKDFPVRFSQQSGRKNLVIPHYHEDGEILKVTRGRVLIQSGNETKIYYNGDIIIFYPNTLHQVCDESGDAEIVSITYKTELTHFAGKFPVKTGGAYLFGGTHPEYLRLDSIFEEAVGLFAHKTDTFEIELTACLLRFSAIFVRCGIMTSSDETKHKSRLSPAFRYVENNLSSVVKISDLEGVLNLSKEQIIRLFKAETGKTPAEYILDLKIKRAMEMLRTDTLSITEISENLGFSNPSHFSKVFKARVNMTPREYKNSLH